MSGLVQMVSLRDGLDRLGLHGLLARMIVWLDINHTMVHSGNFQFEQSLQMSTQPSPFRYTEGERGRVPSLSDSPELGLEMGMGMGKGMGKQVDERP